MSYKYSENTMRAEIDRLTRELAEGKARAVPDGCIAVNREKLERIADAIFSKRHNAQENGDAYDVGYFGKMLEDLEAMLSSPPISTSLPDGWVAVPVGVIDRFPEINPSNYDHDNVCALNAWAVELVLSARPECPPNGLPKESDNE